MMSDFLISVIIPCYDCQMYLEETLLSVFSQTYKNLEIIVVDDGSVTDGSAKICAQYRDKLIYIRQENKGPGAARNMGIKASRGEYLAFIDADDLWLPEKIEKQLNYYEELKKEGKNAGLMYTGLQLIDDKGRDMFKMLYRSSGYNYNALKFLDFIGTPSSVLIKKSVLEDIGGFDEKATNRQDYDLWLRIAKKYETYSLDEYLTRYRDTPDSISKDPGAAITDTEYIFRKEINFSPDNDKIVAYHNRDFANRYKKAAYNSLFNREDGPAFRKYIRKGSRFDKTLFGFKVWIYYILSFLSPRLCKKIKSMKKQKKQNDIIVNIGELKF